MKNLLKVFVGVAAVFIVSGVAMACVILPPTCEAGSHLVGLECVADTPPVEPVLGCTDSSALNYSVDATQDDGSCQFAEQEQPVVVNPGFPGNPPTFAGSSTNAPSCSDTKPGDVANINVVRGNVSDGTVLVQWSLPTNADKAHVIYGEVGTGWHHALLNTPNDGNEEIHLLKNGVKYEFAVAGVNGCAVGNWSKSFVQLP